MEMPEREIFKPYDLEERTELFARRVRAFVKTLPRSVTNVDDVRQLGRASGSVAANYIEANDSLSRKDFRMRLRIARREAKETRLWLRLVDVGAEQCTRHERDELVQEATELMKIMSAILRKVGDGD
jgi:four helix bundle protein